MSKQQAQAVTMLDHSDEGLVCFSYDCDELGVPLLCWFEYEAAEPGSAFEPAYPAFFSLTYAYLPGSTVDLAGVLRDALVEAIHEWVYDHAREVARQAQGDFDIDRWESSRGY